jgi:hypothetical protein
MKRTYDYEIVPIDKSGVQLRKLLSVKSVTGRLDRTTVGAWRFDDVFSAQVYARAKFNAEPATIT